MKTTYLILLIVLIGIISGYSQTYVYNQQFVSGKWTKNKSPYIILGEAIIPAGKALIIEPGVVIQFKTGNQNVYTLKRFDVACLKIKGKIEAIGTEQEPIVFTRQGDAGKWGLIFLYSKDHSSKFSNCRFEHSGSVLNYEDKITFFGAITFYKTSGKVENCIFKNNFIAIDCHSNANPEIINCLIYKNTSGIQCYKTCKPFITSSSIIYNSDNGLLSYSESEPKVKNCIIYGNPKKNRYGSAIVSYSLLEDLSLSSPAINFGNNIFDKDPLFVSSITDNFSLKPNSPCIKTGENSTNIGFKFSDIGQNQNLDPEQYVLFYEIEIQKELDQSRLFVPKGEFESVQQFQERQKKAEKLKKDIHEKYKLKYQQFIADQINTNNLNHILKIKNSWNKFTIDFIDVGAYNTETETFLITIIYKTIFTENPVQISEKVKIPLADAPTFKINRTKIKASGEYQLLDDGKNYQVFNIFLENPINGAKYPFGLQRAPLYQENINIQINEDEPDLNGIPKLEVTVRLNDYSENNILDAEETITVSLDIINNGSADALMIEGILDITPSENIKYNTSQLLQKLKTGEKQTINFQISANEYIQNGEITLNFTFKEKRGFQPAPIKLRIGTQELKTPKLTFIEAGIQEEQGNKNNIIENGELIKATVLIQNKGQREARNIKSLIQIIDPNIISVQTDKFPLANTFDVLKPGEARKIIFLFSVNWNYNGADELPIQLILSEEKGKFGGTFPLELKMKTQSLATNEIKVEGIYSNEIEIENATLFIDVDRNIPVIESRFPNRYALIIGNENYSKYQTNLTLTSNVEFAIRDAMIFRNYAINTFGIPKENIIELYDGQKFQMERDIKAFIRLAELANGKAELFVFYAGHGFPDPETKDAYIMPVDVSGADVNNGIKLADFYKELTKFPNERITVFLDACFSGGGRNEGLIPARSGIRIIPKNQLLNGNIIVFAAGTGEQISLPYRDKKHGLFTYFVLKTLQEHKGNLTYKQFADEIINKVQSHSIIINKQEQNPTINIGNDVTNLWEKWKMN